MSCIKILVIDSGVYNDHPVFKGVNLKDYIFDKELIPIETKPTNGHGTAICGIISRNCESANILSIRLFDTDSCTDEARLINLLKYIYHNIDVDIINLSLGLNICDNYDDFYNICELIKQKGTIIISAFNNAGCISYPAAFDNVIGVISGKKSLKRMEFEYVDDVVVNIAAKGTLQRVAWVDPDFVMMAGNSFACAYVTAKTAMFMLEGARTMSDVLSRFKEQSIAQHYISSNNFSNGIEFTIKNAAVFPFNKEMHSLIRFNKMLTFNIVDVYDSKYSTTVGATTRHLLRDESVLKRTIKNIENIDWSSFDTLILGHLNELSSLLENRILAKELVACAINNKKHIVSFDDLSYLGYKIDPRVYYPKVDLNNLPGDRFGMLYKVSKPVVGIFGTSARQGKFTLQLKIREILTNQGYNVGQIGTEPSSLLYGMDYCFPMGYNSSVYIHEYDTIRYLNYIVNDLCIKNKDIIIVGSQSGTITYDTSNTAYYSVSQYSFLVGTQPDCVVLCVNPYDNLDYISRTIAFIEASVECKVIALTVFPMDLGLGWSGFYGKKTLLDEQKYIELRDRLYHYFNIPVFKLGDDNNMQQLVKEITNYFTV